MLLSNANKMFGTAIADLGVGFVEHMFKEETRLRILVIIEARRSGSQDLSTMMI